VEAAQGKARGAAAIEALSRIGPTAAAAIPSLRKLLHTPDYPPRLVALALWRMGDRSDAVMSCLRAALESKGDYERLEVAKAFHEDNPRDPAMLLILREWLNDDMRRNWAYVELSRLGPAAAEFVPLFIERLGEKDQYSRAYAARALGNIGPAATQAIPALRRAIHDNVEQVRSAAVLALRKIAPNDTALGAGTTSLRKGGSQEKEKG
jgi:hypothetical protein